MNSRSPRMKFVSIFLCCVTLLELIDKQTFGANTDSPQGHESRRFSLFYKVKEGMFKKLLHDSSNSFFNLHHAQFTFSIEGKCMLCGIRLVKNRCHATQAVFIKKSKFRKVFIRFRKNPGRKISTKLIRSRSVFELSGHFHCKRKLSIQI